MIRRPFHRPCAALLAAALAAPSAGALTPPRPPLEYATYGPVRVCGPGFMIAVGPDEAVHVLGDIVRIISDRELLAIKTGNDPNGALPPDGAGAGRGGGFAIRRWDAPTPDAARTRRWVPHALGDADIRYVIAPEGGVPMIVGATAFDGGEGDQRLLARIRPLASRPADCVSLWHAVHAVADGGGKGRPMPPQDARASLFPSHPDTGPGFHCMAGIGFALRADERLWRPWRPLATDHRAYVETGGTTVTLERRGDAVMTPLDSGRADHPLGLLRQSAVIFHPSRGIGPPHMPEGQRDPGSWELVLGANGASRVLTIRFDDEAAAAAGFRFVERLAVMAADDPRCGRPPLSTRSR